MHRSLRACLLSSLISATTITAHAGEVRGYLYDKATGEQVIGATITIKSLGKGAVTGLDGSYYIKNVDPGTYTVSASYVGYETYETAITIHSKDEVVTLNILPSPTSSTLKEIEIKSKADGTTDAYASNKEKNADNIMNIMSAKTIEVSPDITVAEVMQRVSGVSVETNNSGDQYAIIRGMDKRYNTTLVNGIKIPSPDNRDRYVPLDIFPAELLDRLEVVKSLTPGMEADATGGSINLVMKDAPEKLLVEGSFAAGYNTAFQSMDFQKYSTSGVNWKSPAEILGPKVLAPVSDFPTNSLITTNISNPINTTMSLTFGNRFFNNKLGVIVSGSYQSLFTSYHADMLTENVVSAPADNANTNNLPNFSDIIQRQYSMLSKRLGTMAKLDYRFNDKNTISLFAAHIQLDQYRTRTTIDSIPGGSSFNDTWTNIIGTKFKTETRTTLQNIDNITLQGNHKISRNFSADWSLVASQAKRLLPNDAEFSTAQKDSMAVDPVTQKQVYYLAAPHATYVTGQTDEWEHNTDKDLATYINLHYKIYTLPFLSAIDAGGLYRNKHRDNYDNKYSLNQALDTNQQYQLFTSIPASKLEFTRTSDAYGNAAGNAGIYTFSEDLIAYYLQLHINIGPKLKILGGVRVENTQQSYQSSLPVSIAGYAATYDYTDILPSLQGKYDLDKKSGVRFSYFKSLYRPAYADLIPFPDQSSNETYYTKGNPYLQHSVIHNGDVRYELFPKGLDAIMIGAFYKYIINPIEYAVVPQSKTDQILQPGNFGNATNYGFEIVLRKFFGSFGVSGNYTYTHSNINSDKVIYHKKANANDSDYAHVNQSRPLQGQAAHIGNISLLYKNVKQKIEAQLAFVYTGENINTVSYYKDLDVWQKPTLNLDLSAQKQLGKHFTVYLKVKNLLNTGNELFIKQPNTAYSAPSKLPFQESASYYTVERDYYHSSMLIGLRYKLN